nr:SDR family NAD(P)-dependent oxidoreductase [Halorarius litoreus]
MAEELGHAGATVYVTGRSVGDETTDDLPGTVTGTARLVTEAGGEGIAVQCDHTDDDAVEALFERIEREEGHLDLLVNNVWGGYEGYGEGFDAPFWEQSVGTWDAMFDTGVRAHFTASRLAAPLLFASDAGLVVTVSSGDGDKFRGNVPYDTSKAATERMTRGMARELRDRGVAAVAIQPGFTRTERVLDAFDGEEPPEETSSPRYVGRAVVALATDPDVLDCSGEVCPVGELAFAYGFTDVDGSQPQFALGEEWAL